MERTKRLGVDVFTSGQIARMCGVAPRTAGKWIDSGRLKGYRIPGSCDRRVERAELVAFMAANGVPLDALPGGADSGGGRVLAVGLTAEQRAAVAGLAVNGYAVAVVEASDEFDAWVKVTACPPEVVVAAGWGCPVARAADLLRRVRAFAPRAHIVWLAGEYESADDTALAADACDVLVPFPATPVATAEAVSQWREKPSMPQRANGMRAIA